LIRQIRPEKENEMKTEIIVRTGWINNAAEVADISEVSQIDEKDVPKDGLGFLMENKWWREESDDGAIQRHYWVR
jgi:hypothetical protein